MLQVHNQAILSERPDARQIVLVDDSAAERAALAKQIALYEEYDVIDVGNASAALDIAAQHRCDAFLVGMLLPDMSGPELCGLLRQRGLTSPILLLGNDLDDVDVIRGLDVGANDVVSRSARLGVLLARLRAHLRQFEGSSDAILQIGPYWFDVAHKELVETKSHRKLSVTAKEAAILKYLYLNRGKTVDRASLFREVWGMRTDLESHTVQTHIYRLRRKIEPCPSDPRIILSVPGGGYRMAKDSPNRHSAGAHGRFVPRAQSAPLGCEESPQ